MRRYLIPTLAVFPFIFVFDIIFHGYFMFDMYQEVQSLWRPEETLDSYIPLMWLSQFLVGFTLVVLYNKIGKTGSLEDGISFGLGAGALIGVIQASMYTFLPITVGIAVSWFIGALITGCGAGAICALSYSKK